VPQIAAKRDAGKVTAELQGFLEPPFKFPVSFGGQRSIQQTLAAAVVRHRSFAD
jgi:hypothetical protein